MNSQVTLKDVAKAVGLSETTVSLVVNGKAAQRGITPATQARVTSAIRQLGYQPNLITRSIALHQAVPHAAAKPDGISNGKSQIAETEPIGEQIGLVLSTTSQINTLALIPGVEQIVTAAGYRLNIVVSPTDPTSTKERISRLLREAPAGILACPSIYAVVTATVAGASPEPSRRACPVIVLWQDAAKAMLRAVSSGQLSVGSEKNESKAIFSKPIIPSTPAAQPPAKAAAPVSIPPPQQPAVAPVRTPIPPTPAVTPVRPIIIPLEGANPLAPRPHLAGDGTFSAESIAETRPQAPTITSGSTPIETPQAQEPAVVTPEPVIAETPPVTPASTPETTTTESSTPAPEPITGFEPVSSPEQVIVEETPTLDPVVATPTPEPEPTPTPVSEPPPVTPAPDPVIEEEPPPIPEPVFTEIPVTTPIPAPAPPPIIMPEPIVTPPIAEVPPPDPPHQEPIPVAPIPPPVVIEEPAPIVDPNPAAMEKDGEPTQDTEEMATEADVAPPTMPDSQDKTTRI